MQTLETVAHLLRKQEPLSGYTYMKVGGPADYVAIASTKDELVALLEAAATAGLRYLVIGGGSNIIFSDAGYRGMVIINRSAGLTISGNIVTVDSGMTTNALVNQTVTAGLSGLEVFLGIPGTVGGAIYNNSHYLTELIGNHVISAEVWTPEQGTHTMQQADFNFSYDYSSLQQSHAVVLSATFRLTQSADVEILRQTAQAALMRRKQTQPLSLPSSGCMFKNFKDIAVNYPKLPSGITSAGALIDKTGLKKESVGGAAVSDVHANFIVNTGSATTQDIIALSDKLIEAVRKQYGMTLEREVFIVNEYGERIDQ